MATPHHEWTVLPHGTLQNIENSILTVTGEIPMPMGTFERRMTVVRIASGSLVVFSPIALDAPRMHQLEAFGRPGFIVCPGSHHRMDIKPWKDHFPDAKIVAPEGARRSVEELVPVDTSAPEFGDPAARFITVAGTKRDEAALAVEAGGGTTLILNDIVANVHNATGLSGWVAKLFGFAGEKPQVPVPEKLAFIDDKAALAAQLREWAALPALKRIIVSHGDIIEENTGAVLRDIAHSLD